MTGATQIYLSHSKECPSNLSWQNIFRDTDEDNEPYDVDDLNFTRENSHSRQTVDVLLSDEANHSVLPSMACKGSLPVYRDGDDIHAFLIKFESVAQSKGVLRCDYSNLLATCLSGSARRFYADLPPSIRGNYDMLHNALTAGNILRYSELFKGEFKNCMPHHFKSYHDFCSLLMYKFDLWLWAAMVPQTFEDLRTFIVLDQFMSVSPPDLQRYLKKQQPLSLEDAAQLADKWATFKQKEKSSSSAHTSSGGRIQMYNKKENKSHKRVFGSRSYTRVNRLNSARRSKHNIDCLTHGLEDVSTISSARQTKKNAIKLHKIASILQNTSSNNSTTANDGAEPPSPSSLLNRRPSGGIRPRGTNTSSIASKFGGSTTPVFPKVGSFLTSSNPKPSLLGSKKPPPDINPFIGAGPRAEFATIKLKRVSKFSEDKPKLTDVRRGSDAGSDTSDRSKANDVESVSDISENYSKNSESSGSSAKLSIQSSFKAGSSERDVSSRSSPVVNSRESSVSCSSESTVKSNFRVTQSVLIDRCKEVITKNSRSRESSSTRSVVIKSLESSTAGGNINNTVSSSSSSRCTTSVVNQSSLASVSSSDSSSSSTSTALSRSSTIKTTSIPVISVASCVNTESLTVSPSVSIPIKKTKKVSAADSTTTTSSTIKKKKKKVKETDSTLIPESVEIINSTNDSKENSNQVTDSKNKEDIVIEVKIEKTPVRELDKTPPNGTKCIAKNKEKENLSSDSQQPAVKTTQTVKVSNKEITQETASKINGPKKSILKDSTDKNVDVQKVKTNEIEKKKKVSIDKEGITDANKESVPSSETKNESTISSKEIKSEKKIDSIGKDNKQKDMTVKENVSAEADALAGKEETITSKLAAISVSNDCSLEKNGHLLPDSSAAVDIVTTNTPALSPESFKSDGDSVLSPVAMSSTHCLPAQSSATSSTLPSTLSSSPSVCSLSTDTLSTSISTSPSDLSSSPPLPGAPSATFMPSTMSTSTTTLSSTASNMPLLCSTSTSSPAGVASSTVSEPNAPKSSKEEADGAVKGALDLSKSSGVLSPSESLADCFIISVRDMSSHSSSVRRNIFNMMTTATVAHVLNAVGYKFGYDPQTFSLSIQPSSTAEPIELERVELSTPLLDVGFINDGVSRNTLLISNLGSSAPKRISFETNIVGSSRDDDLALGASASPTSSEAEDNTASASVRKKQTWQDLDTAGAGTSSTYASSSTSQPASDYMIYSYGAGSSASLSLSKDAKGYVGLVNQAMTCYLNSLIQTLYMTPEFRNALYRWEFKGSRDEEDKSIPFQLQKLFLLLQTTDRSAVETTKLTRSFGWDSSEAWQQHDIQELCRVMFDALEQCFAKTDQANLIDRLYQGKMKDYVKCLACGKENARMDSFLDVPLPIRPFGSSTAYKSVEEALAAFVAPEVLDGNNQYQCENCDSKQDAHKGLKFTKYPYLLTIHLKRFDFDYQTFHRIKLNDRVTFPDKLDLSEFLDNSGDTMSCSASSKSDSATVNIDDSATDDSGSALDNDDSLVDYTPPHNTTQDEDEGIDLSTPDTDKSSSTDKKKDSKQKSTKTSSATALVNGPEEAAASTGAKCEAEDSSSSSCTTFQLFSIMIHSGSASGGHYYAYIKDLATSEWFCFNDQSVTKISDDDIRRTYGSGRTSSGWTASANAYMLMYRQCDEKRNVLPFSPDNFPEHIKKLRKTLNREEEKEKEAREIEKVTCAIKLFCHLPTVSHLSNTTFKVNKDTTLKEATKQAHAQLELANHVPLERCRLVKYIEYSDALESSFEGMENTPMSEVLGGVKSSYKFDLLMEVREENQKFEAYEPGGVSFRVHVVTLDGCGEVDNHVMVRGTNSMTIGELKQVIAKNLTLDIEHLRLVLECSELTLLSDDTKRVSSLNLYRSNRLFVEASGQEPNDFFVGSQMSSVIDRYLNTITVYCSIPTVTPEILAEMNIPPYTPEVVSTPPQTAEDAATEKVVPKSAAAVSSSSAQTSNMAVQKHNLTLPVPSSAPSVQDNNSSSAAAPPGISEAVEPPQGLSPGSLSVMGGTSPTVMAASFSSDGEEEDAVDVFLGGGFSTRSSDQSTSEDSSLTSDSDRTLVGDPPEEDRLSDQCHSPDYHNVSSPEEGGAPSKNIGASLTWASNAAAMAGSAVAAPAADDEDDMGVADVWVDRSADDPPTVKRYFKWKPATSLEDPEEKNLLELRLDKRMTVDQLKHELQPIVGASSEHFKLFRKCIQEFECSNGSDQLKNFGGINRLIVRLDRALRVGEYKGKIHLFDMKNLEKPIRFPTDWVFHDGDTIGNAKEAIIKEIKAKFNFTLDPARTRLRKKSWKSPLTIYLDNYVFGDDVMLFKNWEMVLQQLPGPEPKQSNEDGVVVFTRWWRPSEYKVEPIAEVYLPQVTAECFRSQISTITGIPPERVEFALSKGAYPCDMSVLDVHTELDWKWREGSLEDRPYNILDDGAMLYYRDKEEQLKELTEAERNELQTEENQRLNKDSIYTVAAAPKPTREKGLKIYFNKE